MFNLGFEKIALDSHSNQGLEFKHAPNEMTSTHGPGGMAPTGFETYEPVEKEKSVVKGKKKINLAQYLMGKMSSVRSENIGNSGSRSNAASTIASQLKDTFSQGPKTHDQDLGDNEEAKNNYKKYKKAEKQ